MERQFSIGTAYLNGQLRKVLKFLPLPAYDEGERLMQDLADRTGDAPIAKRALTAIARSYEKRGKYFEAYQTWADISSRWPTGETGKEALLEMAHSLHSSYRSPRYDPAALESARHSIGECRNIICHNPITCWPGWNAAPGANARATRSAPGWASREPWKITSPTSASASASGRPSHYPLPS